MHHKARQGNKPPIIFHILNTLHNICEYPNHGGLVFVWGSRCEAGGFSISNHMPAVLYHGEIYGRHFVAHNGHMINDC